MREEVTVRSTVLRLLAGWVTVLIVMFSIGVVLPTAEVEAAVVESFTCYTVGDEFPNSGATDDTFVTLGVDKDDNGSAPTTDDFFTVTSETAPTGANNTGAYMIEAVALRPGGTAVYGVGGAVFAAEHTAGTDGIFENADDVGILGNLNTGTGVFSAIGTSIGVATTTYASGVPNAVIVNPATPTDPTSVLLGQELRVDDVDGLTFDHQTGKLWGAVRVIGGGNNSPADQLIIIDPATGRYIGDQFVRSGVTYDSVPIVPDGTTIANTNINAYDIDDLAIDPSTGILYGVANSAGSGDMLVTINKVTGVMSLVGVMGVNDVEGLGFSNVGQTFGEFFATTGNSTGGATDDNFYIVNKGTGVASDLTPAYDFVTTTDLESMDCLSSNVRRHTISGYVFLDANKDGINGEDLNGNGVLDAGEDGTKGFAANSTLDRDAGQAGVEVRLFHDRDNDGVADADTPDRFLDQAVTNAQGYYSFEVSIPAGVPQSLITNGTVPVDFALDIITPVSGAAAHPVFDRSSTLPGGSIMTTDLTEEASFTGSESGDTTERSNDFGFVTAPDITKTSSNLTAPNTTDPVLPGTDEIEYTVVLKNDSASNITTAIKLTDTLPVGLAYKGNGNGTLGDADDLTVVYTGVDHGVTVNDEFQTGTPGRSLDLSLGGLDAGATVTVKFKATTTNSIVGGSVTNTACREYNSRTICDSETDAVVGSIGDFVWRDLDLNGIQDGGTETGIGSIAVTLQSSPDADCTDADQTVKSGPVDTSGTGIYRFDRLETGYYCVDVDGADANMPAGYVLTGSQTDPRLVDLDVTDNTKRLITTADFGYAVAPRIDLELSKSVDDATPSVGDDVTFTLNLVNAGATATTDASGVTVTDALPAGLTYQSHTTAQGTYDDSTGVWTVGALADGAATSMTITAKVDSEGTHTNKAQVTAASQTDVDSTPNDRTFPADAPVSDDEAEASVSTPAAPAPAPAEPQYIDLELTKDASKTHVAQGDEVTFTIRLENVVPGATATAMNVVVTDELPPGLTFVSATPSKGTYDPGTGAWRLGTMRRTEVQTLTVVARAAEPGSHRNVAYVSGASGDDVDSSPGPPNDPFQDDEDDAVVEVGLVDLELTKEVSDGTVTVGEEFLFTISVVNVEVPDSPRTTATDVQVTDAVPAGLRVVRVSSTSGDFDTETFLWFVGDLDVGDSASLALVVVADREGTYVNVAQVSSAVGKDVDSTPGNDVPEEDDQDEAEVVVTILGAIGDYVWLDHNGDGVQDPGEVGLPGVSVALAGPFNSAPVSPAAIQTDDSLQTNHEGRYLFQELEPGLYLIVVLEDTVPGELSNTNGTSWYEVNIGPGASYLDADFGYQPAGDELSVVKSVSPAGRVSMGDEPIYTITVSNTGSRTLTGVVVADRAPQGTTYRPGTTTVDGDPYPDTLDADDPLPLNPDNGGIALGDLEPGESRQVQFGVTVDFMEPREIPNVASVKSGQTGWLKSNEVVIATGVASGSTEILPVTGGPFDRLLLLGGGAIALGVVTLLSVRPPDPRRRRRGRRTGPSPT